MNKEEKLEKIHHMANYFFVSFWVSVIFLLASTLYCIVFSEFYSELMSSLFSVDSEDYSKIVLYLLGIWKILIVQFTLIPGIALWIIGRHCGSKKVES